MTPDEDRAFRERVGEAPAAPPIGSYELSDLGNAERLIAAHGDDLRWIPGLGWFAWDGSRWQRDESGEPLRRAKLTARAILHDAANCDDEALRKATAKWARASEAEPRLRAAVSLAASERRVIANPADLDTDPWAFNTFTGTIDLRTGKLRTHRREDMLTKLAPVAYDPDAQCPVWTEFLRTIFAGDEDLIDYVQRWAGYSLTGSTREQVIALCWGAGSNGKTTMQETLRRALGDYAAHTPSSTLLERDHGDAIPNDLARLRGTRLVTASETGDGRRLDEERVKAITGSDVIAARYMRAEWFEFRPNFKVWASTNHLPRVRGTDHALWRRIRLIPFSVTIADEDQDRDLPEKLTGETPGILAWAVRGCLDWQRHGLGAPEAVTNATREYRTDMDLIGRFLADCCEIKPDAEAEAGALWLAFCTWAEANHERTGTQTAFGRQLTERGFETRRQAKARKRIGLQLLDADGPDDGQGW